MASAFSEFKKLAVVNTPRSCQFFAGLPPADLEKTTAVKAVKSLGTEDYLYLRGSGVLISCNSPR